MYISKFTDYSFRCLIHLAINNERLCTVDELSKSLNISENHIKKIVHNLAKGNFINSIKGRSGGITLGSTPENINIADVLIYCKEIDAVIECYKNENSCSNLKKSCKLKKIIDNSMSEFINELKKYTLADII